MGESGVERPLVEVMTRTLSGGASTLIAAVKGLPSHLFIQQMATTT